MTAEQGVVVVRGTVDRADQIADVDTAVRRVQGVREVRNLLQLP